MFLDPDVWSPWRKSAIIWSGCTSPCIAREIHFSVDNSYSLWMIFTVNDWFVIQTPEITFFSHARACQGVWCAENIQNYASLSLHLIIPLMYSVWSETNSQRWILFRWCGQRIRFCSNTKENTKFVVVCMNYYNFWAVSFVEKVILLVEMTKT